MNQVLSHIILGIGNIVHRNWEIIKPLNIRGSIHNVYTTTGLMPGKLKYKVIKYVTNLTIPGMFLEEVIL